MTRRTSLVSGKGLLVLFALSACTARDSGGGVDAATSGDGGVSVDAGAQSSCPAAPPAASATCAGVVATGTTCIYERCGAEGIVRATCDAATDGPAWSITTGSCGSETCNGFACSAGTVCTANVGGAYIVDCRAHACETGPLTCECVCGAGTQCEVGDSSGGGAEFTCYVDCGAEICAFPGLPHPGM